MANRENLTSEGRAKVSAAVSAVEAHTAGEVVTILAETSDSYADVALVWSVAVGFASLCALALVPDAFTGIYERLTGGWIHEWTPRALLGMAMVAFAITFGAMWLLQLWRPFRLWLVPRPTRNARVRHRAITSFRIGAERRTHGRTGILIYLSMAEHRAEIVADEAIAGQVSPEVWGEAMTAMLPELRAGRVAEGMVAAVERVGEVLAQHFPREENDVNELPDRLIEV